MAAALNDDCGGSGGQPADLADQGHHQLDVGFRRGAGMLCAGRGRRAQDAGDRMGCNVRQRPGQEFDTQRREHVVPAQQIRQPVQPAAEFINRGTARS